MASIWREDHGKSNAVGDEDRCGSFAQNLNQGYPVRDVGVEEPKMETMVREMTERSAPDERLEE